MKTEEDEAFEAIERRQGGFQAKRAMAADKLQEPVREALKLALEALEHISKFGCNHVRGVCTCEYREAADAIKEALAQPAQEQRPWVRLTPEETSGFTQHEMTVVKYVSKVLQEKNNG